MRETSHHLCKGCLTSLRLTGKYCKAIAYSSGVCRLSCTLIQVRSWTSLPNRNPTHLHLYYQVSEELEMPYRFLAPPPHCGSSVVVHTSAHWSLKRHRPCYICPTQAQRGFCNIFIGITLSEGWLLNLLHLQPEIAHYLMCFWFLSPCYRLYQAI